MTGSYKSLVDRLRETRLFYKGDYSIEAADRIEALEAENERLTAEVVRQMQWKTEAQNEAEELATALDNIAKECSDAWARGKARAALGESHE